MADNAVEFKFFANAAAAEKAIVQLEKKYTDLENKVRNMGKVSRKSADEAKSAFDLEAAGLKNMDSVMGAMISRFGPLAAGIGVVTAAVRGSIDANKQWSQSTSEAVKRHEEAKIRLKIQAGLTPQQVRSQELRVAESLEQIPSTDFKNAYAMQTELAASGFNEEDVNSGKALKAMLRLNVATTAFGRGAVDPTEATQAIGQFLMATGEAVPGAEMMDKVGGQIATMFNASKLKFADVLELSGEASSLTAMGVSREDMLAAFTSIQKVKSGAEAATGLRGVATDLGTAGASKEKTRLLKGIGLRPEDVDLVGEDIFGALDRMKGALSTKSKEKQNQFLAGFFGERQMSSAAQLMADLDVKNGARELRASLDGGKYGAAIDQFIAGRTAMSQRMQNRAEFSMVEDDRAQGSYTWDEYRERRKSEFAEMRRGQPWYMRTGQGLGETVTGWFGSLAEGLGGTPAAPAVRGKNASEDRELTNAIRENTAALKANGRIPNRNANGEK